MAVETVGTTRPSGAESFVKGVIFAGASGAESEALRTARVVPIGPSLHLGDGAIAQVVFYPARVQATFEGKPIFAEKIAAVPGIEVVKVIVEEGREFTETRRFPYHPGFAGVPEEIVHSLENGLKRR